MAAKEPQQHSPLFLAAVCCTGEQWPVLPLKEQQCFSGLHDSRANMCEQANCLP